MLKKILCAGLIFVLIACFSWILKYCYIEYSNDEDETVGTFVYQNKTYYANYIFDVTQFSGVRDEEDVLISSSIFSEYYSYTENDPIYIYCISKGLTLYLSEDYDYQSDRFVIEETNSSFVFSEAISDQKYTDYDFDKAYPLETTFDIHSETYPKIRTTVKILLEDDKWYAVLDWDMYEVSDEFVDLLIENGIISD